MSFNIPLATAPLPWAQSGLRTGRVPILEGGEWWFVPGPNLVQNQPNRPIRSELLCSPCTHAVTLASQTAAPHNQAGPGARVNEALASTCPNS